MISWCWEPRMISGGVPAALRGSGLPVQLTVPWGRTAAPLSVVTNVSGSNPRPQPASLQPLTMFCQSASWSGCCLPRPLCAASCRLPPCWTGSWPRLATLGRCRLPVHALPPATSTANPAPAAAAAWGHPGGAEAAAALLQQQGPAAACCKGLGVLPGTERLQAAVDPGRGAGAGEAGQCFICSGRCHQQ